MARLPFLSRLRSAERGAVAIETAIVAPVLVMMALGAFDASSIVARQTELQSAAAEAAAIVRAKPPTDASERTTIDDVVEVSAGLTEAQVTIAEVFRCGTATVYALSDTCLVDEKVSTYIKITVTDTYEPVWTQFGVGEDVSYNIERVVQIS
jgi:Flp pilus assembly protein TadG